MRTKLTLLLLLFISAMSNVVAQYGNEWLVPGQPYFKIPTAQDGMYAITYGQLQASGVDMGVDPRRFQLWHRGVEQNILIKGEGDGVFNTNDSLIFYGKMNDGTLDLDIFNAAPGLTPPLNQPHNYYNIYSDTTAYFLTWGAGNVNKRITTNFSNTVVPSSSNHIAHFLKVYSDNYSKGLEHGDAHQTYGDVGETWCSNPFTTTMLETIPVNNVDNTGQDFNIEVMIVGRNNTYSRDVRLTLSNLGSPDIVESFTSFNTFNKNIFSKSYSSSLLNTNSITVTIDATNTPGNRISAAYIKITYPQTIGMFGNSSKIFRPAVTNVQNFYTLNWTSSFAPIVFDYTDKNNIKLLNTSIGSGNLTVFSPALVTEFMVMQSNAYLPIISLKQVDMEPYDTTKNYIILTHPKLWSEAQEYANYRSSFEGGSHNVMMVSVEKIYDQFSYGEYTPVGIKRFCDYQSSVNENIENLFIIGKGVDIQFGQRLGFPYYRKNSIFHINHPNPENRIENLVPPYGYPPSDIYFGMKKGPGGFDYKPNMAVSRLSAKSGVDIISYLNKVKEFEQVDSNLLWRKNLVHLSGGQDAGQVTLFKSYVDGFKSIVENSSFKGNVINTYVKNLNLGEAIDKNSIAEDVNEGLNVVTFFGHSTSYITELDIGNVSEPIYGYNNKGKYPFLIINGCESAAAYLAYTSLCEDWINTPDLGAIAVIGVSDIGYTSPLKNYTDAMYTGMFNVDSLKGRPIGEVMKKVLRSYSFDNQTVLQMNLHGDPAVKVYSPKQTDYEISGDKEVRDDKPEYKCFLKSFDGKLVNAAMDSFQIGIPVKNFGAYNKEKFYVLVKRTVNGIETVFKEKQYSPVNYLDTLYFTINGNTSNQYGLTNFYIKVDSRDTIHEMKEDNNEANLEYFMSLSGVTCLFPKEFSIVHNQPITFIAQSTNLMVAERQYYIEVDSSYLFNSPIRQSSVITSGSLIKWPNINLYSNNSTDSIVYYWRVRFNNFAAGEDTVWGTSSFIYIKDSPDGWSQSEEPQFMKDVTKNMYMDLADSTWKFSASSLNLSMEVFGNGTGTGLGNDVDNTVFKFGEIEVMFPGYTTQRCGEISGSLGGEEFTYEADGMIGVSIDKSTLENYYVPGFPRCGRWPTIVANHFRMGVNLVWCSYLDQWLNSIPVGDYIILGNSGNAAFSSWPAYLKDNFANNFGAQMIYNTDDNEPYLILAQKGNSTPIIERHSDDTFASLKLDTTITSKFNNGSVLSTRIGPSTEWGTFYQRVFSSGQDKHEFKILGEKLDGTVDTLNLNLVFYKNSDNIDTIDLEPLIDANVYPYLKLSYSAYDSTSLTPPQLDRWQVIYRKSPEGTMDPFTAGLDMYKIPTKDEGSKICLPYVFENIADLPFRDSIYVKVTARGDGSIVRDTSYLVYPDTLNPGEAFRFMHCTDTKGLYGKVSIKAFVNPYLQPEEYYSNNVIETYFDVVRDKIPPVIDVMFDGVHIMDGDIVSPSPLISIVLNDNSKFLLMDNPNNVSIFFKKEGEPEVQILPSNPNILKYGQTAGNSNTFTIEYQPKDLEDGVYSIIVQGKDVNGNKSGQYSKVTFTVENASTISNFYPYPNPFSTSTRFVFTLTGRYVPEDLKIQIMTVTGKVVREITKDELGYIHIGNNKTEYAWNGTDEFGDKLANGVYLYRVVIKNKGENFEHRNTAGDRAFKKEFGKLYILR